MAHPPRDGPVTEGGNRLRALNVGSAATEPIRPPRGREQMCTPDPTNVGPCVARRRYRAPSQGGAATSSRRKGPGRPTVGGEPGRWPTGSSSGSSRSASSCSRGRRRRGPRPFEILRCTTATSLPAPPRSRATIPRAFARTGTASGAADRARPRSARHRCPSPLGPRTAPSTESLADTATLARPLLPADVARPTPPRLAIGPALPPRTRGIRSAGPRPAWSGVGPPDGTLPARSRTPPPPCCSHRFPCTRSNGWSAPVIALQAARPSGVSVPSKPAHIPAASFPPRPAWRWWSVAVGEVPIDRAPRLRHPLLHRHQRGDTDLEVVAHPKPLGDLLERHPEPAKLRHERREPRSEVAPIPLGDRGVDPGPAPAHLSRGIPRLKVSRPGSGRPVTGRRHTSHGAPSGGGHFGHSMRASRFGAWFGVARGRVVPGWPGCAPLDRGRSGGGGGCRKKTLREGTPTAAVVSASVPRKESEVRSRSTADFRAALFARDRAFSPRSRRFSSRSFATSSARAGFSRTRLASLLRDTGKSTGSSTSSGARSTRSSRAGMVLGQQPKGSPENVLSVRRQRSLDWAREPSPYDAWRSDRGKEPGAVHV